MSQPIDDGGVAFPWVRQIRCQGIVEDTESMPGMSLRDWLAGQERIDSSEEYPWELCEALAGPRPSGSYSTNALEFFDWDNKWRAAIRYARADAMIVARKGGAQ